MNKLPSFLQLFSLIALPLMSAQCEKDDDQFNILYGKNTIEGAILYRDAYTNVLDTAKDAYLELKKFGTDSVTIAARKDLSVTSDNGRFKFSDLPDGKYALDIRYIDQSIVYLKKDTVDTNDPESIAKVKVVELQFDANTDYSLASISGRVWTKNSLTNDTLPANGAHLLLTGPKGAGLEKNYNGKTDNQGAYKFERSTTGTYTLKVDYQKELDNKITSYKITEEILITRNTSSIKDITLNDNGTDYSLASLSGIVLAENPLTKETLPASEAHLILTGPKNAGLEKNYDGKTNSQGSYKFQSLPEGTYILKIDYEKEIGNKTVLYQKTEEAIIITKNTPLQNEDITLSIEPDTDFIIANVNGRALFEDEFTELFQPAVNANVILELLTEKGGSLKNPQITYTSTTNDRGDFIVHNLPGGFYNITIVFSQNTEDFPVILDYNKSITDVEVIKNSTNKPETLKNAILALETDRLLNPLGKVKVESEATDRIKNAKVMLYATQSAMQADSLKGLTSVASGVTNQRGIVLFTDLDPKTYYINSQVVIGQDTLTSTGSDTIELEEKKIKEVTVTLK